jgi:hypothetical protein
MVDSTMPDADNDNDNDNANESLVLGLCAARHAQERLER